MSNVRLIVTETCFPIKTLKKLESAGKIEVIQQALTDCDCGETRVWTITVKLKKKVTMTSKCGQVKTGKEFTVGDLCINNLLKAIK